jgi:5,5'-dehydrodivanillate O-demethylase oxygenase subunit
VLNPEENRQLTQVGPGTPMGALLRRYWMPIAPVAELDERPTKAVRLLGESLVLYKDRSGRYGLVQARCPHRGADLSHGMVDECGLRCSYHGWLFGNTGQCLAQPFEDLVDPEARFKDRIRIDAYPVESNAGVLWAYLGPEPVPVVPNWRNFHRKGYKHLCFVEIPCNWLQVMENAFDQVHNEWMHDKWSFYIRDGEVPSDRWQVHRIIHREFDYGWTAEVEYANADVFPDRVILFPNYSCLGGGFEWVVPIDDANTLLVYQHCTRFYTEAPFKQDTVPYWNGSIRDPQTGRLRTLPPRNQDVVVWVGQGVVADRTAEHLGRSDVGVIAYRKRLQEQVRVVASGCDPKGVVRNRDEYFLMLPESVPSGPQRDGLPGALRTPAEIRTIGYVAGFPEALAAEIERISNERGEGAERARVLKEAGWKVGGKDFNRSRHFSALATRGLTSGGSAPGRASEV